jgi:hypothetical protein
MSEAPLELSRYAIPYTPFRGKLEEATISLVTTAGVRQKDDRPFILEGDNSYRVIDGSKSVADLTYDDAHYDHECADPDLNCIFPLDRLGELGREGRIAGTADKHFSMGFSQALRELRQTTIPSLVRELERVRPTAVLLTGG